MAEGKGSAVIYMLRTAQQHHVQLSMMADQKASALLAACFVTLSISVAYASNHQPSLPLLVIMTFAVLSAFFAAFAVMPRIHLRKAAGTPRNLLFFGALAYRCFILGLLAAPLAWALEYALK